MYLNKDSITVYIDLEKTNIQENKRKNVSRFKSLTGIDYFQQDAVYNVFNLNYSLMPFSDGMQINEWWKDQKTLEFNYDSTSYGVIISNELQPNRGFSEPYQDYFDGNLTLEEIL